MTLGKSCNFPDVLSNTNTVGIIIQNLALLFLFISVLPSPSLIPVFLFHFSIATSIPLSLCVAVSTSSSPPWPHRSHCCRLPGTPLPGLDHRTQSHLSKSPAQMSFLTERPDGGVPCPCFPSPQAPDQLVWLSPQLLLGEGSTGLPPSEGDRPGGICTGRFSAAGLVSWGLLTTASPPP